MSYEMKSVFDFTTMVTDFELIDFV